MSDPIRVFDPAMKLRERVHEAKEKGLWFYQASQGLWYSPEEMEKNLAEDITTRNVCPYIQYWELRDPEKMISELERKCRAATDELWKTKERVDQWRKSREVKP